MNIITTYTGFLFGMTIAIHLSKANLKQKNISKAVSSICAIRNKITLIALALATVMLVSGVISIPGLDTNLNTKYRHVVYTISVVSLTLLTSNRLDDKRCISKLADWFDDYIIDMGLDGHSVDALSIKKHEFMNHVINKTALSRILSVIIAFLSFRVINGDGYYSVFFVVYVMCDIMPIKFEFINRIPKIKLTLVHNTLMEPVNKSIGRAVVAEFMFRWLTIFSKTAPKTDSVFFIQEATGDSDVYYESSTNQWYVKDNGLLKRVEGDNKHAIMLSIFYVLSKQPSDK